MIGPGTPQSPQNPIPPGIDPVDFKNWLKTEKGIADPDDFLTWMHMSPGQKIGEPWKSDVKEAEANPDNPNYFGAAAKGFVNEIKQVPSGMLNMVKHPLNTLRNMPQSLVDVGKGVAQAVTTPFENMNAQDRMARLEQSGKTLADLGTMDVAGRAIGGFTRGVKGGMEPEVPAPGAFVPPRMMPEDFGGAAPKRLSPDPGVSTRDFAMEAVKNAPPKEPLKITSTTGVQDPAVLNKTLNDPEVAKKVFDAVANRQIGSEPTVSPTRAFAAKAVRGEPNVTDPNAQMSTQTTQPENLTTESARVESNRPANPFGEFMSDESGSLRPYLLYRLAETLARKGIQSGQMGNILGNVAGGVGRGAFGSALMSGMQPDSSTGIR